MLLEVSDTSPGRNPALYENYLQPFALATCDVESSGRFRMEMFMAFALAPACRWAACVPGFLDNRSHSIKNCNEMRKVISIMLFNKISPEEKAFLEYLLKQQGCVTFANKFKERDFPFDVYPETKMNDFEFRCFELGNKLTSALNIWREVFKDKDVLKPVMLLPTWGSRMKQLAIIACEKGTEKKIEALLRGVPETDLISS